MYKEFNPYFNPKIVNSKSLYPPKKYQSYLEQIDTVENLNDDEKLSVGEKLKGGLQWAQSYKVIKKGLRLYRVWNSFNPNSKYGNWWTFYYPSGDISQYRIDYDICSEWSPLDRLVSSELKVGSIIVLGPGQSAKCSEWTTLDKSDKQQVYVVDPHNTLIKSKNDKNLKLHFKWV